MTRTPELLAPAGNMEALFAAVANGADAVYLAGQRFGARASAGNFSMNELKEALEHCHFHGVKTYLTLNTLLFDKELEDALEQAHLAYQLGIDAIIIQDKGLITPLRRELPELKLHASTQMTVHNTAQALWFQEMGFERVILTRELELSEITRINEETDIGLEVFVHGALCFCYSGQCLMSSFIGDRSGNRGRCAQPCRREYQLHPKIGLIAHKLSMKDLQLAQYLTELSQAGVASMKIEGRMRSPGYVGVVVRTYRRLLDELAIGRPVELSNKESHDLLQVFNREFTPGYSLDKSGKDVVNTQRPDNRGVELGKVVKFNNSPKRISVKLVVPLRLGDGVEFTTAVGDSFGFSIGVLFRGREKLESAEPGETVEIPIRQEVEVGSNARKTFDARLNNDIKRALKGTCSDIEVSIRGVLSPNSDLELSASDDDGHIAELREGPLVQVAKKSPLDRNKVIQMLQSSGGTGFTVTHVDLTMDGNCFMPVSELKKARRDVLIELKSMRIAGHARPQRSVDWKLGSPADITSEASPRKPLLTVSTESLDGVKPLIAERADWIYFPLFHADAKSAIKLAKGSNPSIALELPVITLDHQLDRAVDILDGLIENGLSPDALRVGNIGALRRLEPHFDGQIFASSGLNLQNSVAMNLAAKSFSRFQVSLELDRDELLKLNGPLELEVQVQGAVQVMLTRQEFFEVHKLNPTVNPCLEDRTGAMFPVRPGMNGGMRIFNSRDLCLLDYLEELKAFDCFHLNLALNRPKDAATTLAIYRDALNWVMDGKELDLSGKTYLKSFSKQGITAGHYNRPVL